jgi:glutamine phosphoribosylpyrophosphate amidotransferase
MTPDDGGASDNLRGGFRDECGVFGIYGHDDAARLTYLGLYQLQHRGQESCGIVASDGAVLRQERAMGLVSEVFDEERLNRLPGLSAIGHTRYSTAGEVSVREAQPFLVGAGPHGQVALCPDGNLPLRTPVMIRFGEMTEDEVFITQAAAQRGVEVVNTGAEPLVTLRYFGPEQAPGVPEVGGR